MWKQISALLTTLGLCWAAVEITLVADVELDYNKCNQIRDIASTEVRDYVKNVSQRVLCDLGSCEDVTVILQGCKEEGKIHHVLKSSLNFTCPEFSRTVRPVEAFLNKLEPYFLHETFAFQELTKQWPWLLVSAKFNVTCPSNWSSCENFSCDEAAAAAEQQSAAEASTGMSAGAIAGTVLGSLAGLGALAGAALALTKFLRPSPSVDDVASFGSFDFSSPEVPEDRAFNVRFTPR